MIRKISGIFIVFIVFISFISCQSQTTDGIENDYNANSKTIQIYNNRLYYFDGTTVAYRRLTDSPENMEILCSDSLCGHASYSCPLFLGWSPSRIMAIDGEESRKNNNYPIIYISHWIANSESSRDGSYRIIRYNSAKNTSEVIISNIPNPIAFFYLYKNYIFYVTADGDAGYNIHSVAKDGRNKYSLDNPNNNLYILIGAENDTLYYSDWFGNIFLSDLQLKSNSFVIQTNSAMGAAYIYDGFLYYANDYGIAAIMGTTEIMNCNFYRIPLDNLSDIQPEKLIENVFYSILPYCFQVKNRLYYCAALPEYIGLGHYYAANNEKQDIDFYYNSTGTIYSYNMETGEVRVEIENDGFDLLSFFGGSGDYIIYDLYRVQTDITKPYGNFDETPLFAFNIVSKEQIEITGVRP